MAKSASKSSDGTLLGLLLGALYSVFTLLPSSHSMMVSWPWVFVWQIALMLPILWLLWQLWSKPLRQFRLGAGLDIAILVLVLAIVLSTVFAEFPNQARWYTWAAIGFVAATYALSAWVTTPQRALRLLQFQAVLGFAFILVSLGLWVVQTYLPELARLDSLQQLGINEVFNFNRLSLRNWHPIGHQNYVAGYLLLILPLLAGFVIVGQRRWRWLGLGGCLLGVVDLYTTSSRGGLLALVLMTIVAGGIALWHSQFSKLRLIFFGILACLVLAGGTLANIRARNLISAVLRGDFASGELAYRWITNVIGWRMGLEHPWIGAGPGSVPMLYQRYRPYWAGREAELHFQLHSTPAQLWAEFGGIGMVSVLLLIALLVRATWRWTQMSPQGHALPRPLIWSMLVGFVGYGLISLTDYQLDNICISGVIVLYGVVLSKTMAGEADAITFSAKPQRLISGVGLGIALAVALWLGPIHRAWAAASRAFQALQQEDIPTFQTQLQRAYELSPWEAYYPYQLGWQLGDISFQNPDGFRRDAIHWFTAGNQASPYQEFGQSNLGWLLISEDAQQAKTAFAKAAQLVPAKPGAFLGLGYSLLRSGETDLAVKALTLEVLRHPSIISSGIWRFPQFAPLYESVLQQSIEQCSAWLSQPSFQLTEHLHRLRASLYWWQGNLTAAAVDWEKTNSVLGAIIVSLSQGNFVPENLVGLVNSPSKLAIEAWLRPEQRQVLLTKALTTTPVDELQLERDVIPSQVGQLLSSMEAADSFEHWLKQTAPMVEPRNQRLGFGVLSRHIDGRIPKDYQPRIENLPVKQFFEELFPSPRYLPQWDSLLQPIRDQLLISVSE